MIKCRTPTLNTEPTRFLSSKGDVQADPSPHTLKSSEMQQTQSICTVTIKSSLTQCIQYEDNYVLAPVLNYENMF